MDAAEILKDYKPALRCPWSGVECDCQQFPWLENGSVPVNCVKLMKEKAPAMLTYRKT